MTSWPMNRTRPSTSARVSGLATSWSSAASLRAPARREPVAQALGEMRARAPRPRARGDRRRATISSIASTARSECSHTSKRCGAGWGVARIARALGQERRRARRARRGGGALALPRARPASATSSSRTRSADDARERRARPRGRPIATPASRLQPGRTASRAARRMRTGSSARAPRPAEPDPSRREVGQPPGRVLDRRRARSSTSARERRRERVHGEVPPARGRAEVGRAEVRDVDLHGPRCRQTPRALVERRRRPRRGRRRARAPSRSAPWAPPGRGLAGVSPPRSARAPPRPPAQAGARAPARGGRRSTARSAARTAGGERELDANPAPAPLIRALTTQRPGQPATVSPRGRRTRHPRRASRATAASTSAARHARSSRASRRAARDRRRAR